MDAPPSPVPTLEFERAAVAQGHRVVAGVDEVGRGSWAGPVVAGAVILPLERTSLLDDLGMVRDSKELTAAQREEAFREIVRICPSVAIGWSTHHCIDEDGLGYANRRALLRAVQRLKLHPDMLLIDFFHLWECALPQTCIVKGDALSLSIACASVVAKVVRDRWMRGCDRRIPGYGFAQHKGYGTPLHRAAIAELGPSRIHRLSFAPLQPRLF